MSKPRSVARVKTLPAAMRENLIATPRHSSAFSTPSRISADRCPVTQSNFLRARATANPSGLSIAPPSQRPEGFLSKDEKLNNGPSSNTKQQLRHLFPLVFIIIFFFNELRDMLRAPQQARINFNGHTAAQQSN